MTDTRFGGSAGLLQRLRPVRIGVADLREVADTVLPALTTSRLRLHVVQRSGAGSLVVLEEDERRVRTHLGELADDMTRAGVSPTHEGIAAALVSWVAHRPVTDAAAAATGIAVLDWSDRSETSVGWRIVVRRGALALPWTPSSSADADTIGRTRASATGRAHDVPLTLRVEGPVALWAHPEVPVLASAALVAPRRMLERIQAAGLDLTDMHVVVTPRRPVACAGPAVAARLAGETTEASVTLAWSRLADLSWL
ncbi:hypothetical protein FHU33_4121 [Blastococcus colisei]|uniref:Uncharacterized protein n=1 Tax=Blastococcus colisei TaxID=1564162 RepID=A0A543P046_9ACTN|nr:hypothetical protein [Blastococcus colisei]TQN37469.1 hypothetical protein FHU33_4121 [Blastococcus colisei]